MTTAAVEEQQRKIQLGEIFAAIEHRYGALTPTNLVQEAAAEEHPLHDRFEWDNAKAAELCRLNQARALLRLPRSTVIISGCRIVSPTYVHNPGLAAGEQGYVPVARIKSDQDLASDALDAEVGRAASALLRARGIAVALGDDDIASRIMEALIALERA